ncbi:hypothetical protein ALP33_200182 [Pseudomonas amygdali pv. lachrymans]|uniref:Uncharacterized protein n=1 Tax=Pseudomonas amygdali pv. lachrymans TaxID=53707 RepID=A0AB37RA68_PSEAV|nr:hypothetical protein ALQ79_05637 [Pseudomonas amygdali pv. lachrymans]RMP38303.1 hypothetical protein ALQ26_05978 [Pseudomonas amygdali pv. lachrymans]RMU22992.1 hypothetical protein ALP33_200182 [Pseudomonas amygdali pv. lachrymans]
MNLQAWHFLGYQVGSFNLLGFPVHLRLPFVQLSLPGPIIWPVRPRSDRGFTFHLFDHSQLGDGRNGFCPAEAGEHFLGLGCAHANPVLGVIGDDKKIEGLLTACFEVFPCQGLEVISQRRPAEFDVDELGDVVGSHHVTALDVKDRFFMVAYVILVLAVGFGLAHLSLGAQHLHHQPRAVLELETIGGRIAIAAGKQVLAGFLAPGDGEVLVYIVENRPGQHARDVLAWRRAARAEIGLRLGAFFTVQCRVLIGVPILVQRIVTHDKADRAGQFIVYQYTFLVVRGAGAQDEAHAHADIGIERFILHPVLDL